MKLLVIILFLALPMLAFAFPPGYAAKMKGAKPNTNAIYVGIVKETKTSSSYTYAKVSGKDGDKWVATSATTVNKGDKVEFLKGQVMKDFHSKGMDKTFKEIYFSQYIKILKQAVPATSSVKKGSFKKAKYSVAEIFEKAKSLVGKKVKLRGKVVKFSAGIMGKNWIHLQDGTSHSSQFDLVITTQDKVKKGDTVLVNAKVATDKDFGYGYKYPVLLEDAKVSVE